MPKNDSLQTKLHQVAKAYNISADHPLTLIAAALRLHGFTVRSMGEGYARVYEKNFGIDNGPHVWIESPQSRDLEDKELAQSNLRERERLVDLLGEFYSSHKSTIATRLIVQNMAAGGSLLNCQGAEIMGLPEHDQEHEQWLKQAFAEMQAFAEFLLRKL